MGAMSSRDGGRQTTTPLRVGVDAEVLGLTRPHRNLLWLYSAYALASLCVAPIVWVPLYFKFHTLRYRLDTEGISASWGILFRREIHLTYKRIQDIHVKRNLVERWLGIATIQVQTASGGQAAELALEGIRDHDAVREFLYRRMRGHESARAPESAGPDASVLAGASGSRPGDAELLGLLRDLKHELEATRRAIEGRRA